MCKEYIQALEHFVRTSVWNEDEFHEIWDNGNSDLEIVKQALKRLESIDNASISEAWECLEKLGKHELKQDCLVEDLTVYDTIKYALLKAQKLNIENSKYKQLEKEKGCPLEVYYQIITGRKNLIYDELGEVCVIKFIKDDYITVDIRFKGTFNFKISDYKKTWWLREDRNE